MSCDFLTLATAGVQKLQPYQPGKPMEELERELGLTEIIKLASNENPLGPGARARAAVRAQIDELGRYPDGNGFALKEILSQRVGAAPDSVTLGNGSNDVLELIVRAFCTPEHEVIFSQHAFAVYPLATQAVGAEAVVTPALDWGHDLDAMANAITDHTRIIFVANPNNPTGTWSTGDAVKTLLGATPDDVLVVVDEAYREYVDEPAYPNCAGWVEQHPNLIVTRSFSKIYGLGGLRIGYAISDPVVADILNRVRQPFNVNNLAMAGAVASLQDDEHVATSIAHNRVELARLTDAFSGLGLAYVPSVGNFVSVDVGRDALPVYDALLREGVIVRPIGGGYGMPNHLRVTVGLESENTRFLQALEKVLSERP